MTTIANFAPKGTSNYDRPDRAAVRQERAIQRTLERWRVEHRACYPTGCGIADCSPCHEIPEAVAALPIAPSPAVSATSGRPVLKQSAPIPGIRNQLQPSPAVDATGNSEEDTRADHTRRSAGDASRRQKQKREPFPIFTRSETDGAAPLEATGTASLLPEVADHSAPDVATALRLRKRDGDGDADNDYQLKINHCPRYLVWAIQQLGTAFGLNRGSAVAGCYQFGFDQVWRHGNLQELVTLQRMIYALVASNEQRVAFSTPKGLLAIGTAGSGTIRHAWRAPLRKDLRARKVEAAEAAGLTQGDFDVVVLCAALVSADRTLQNADFDHATKILRGFWDHVQQRRGYAQAVAEEIAERPDQVYTREACDLGDLFRA